MKPMPDADANSQFNCSSNCEVALRKKKRAHAQGCPKKIRQYTSPAWASWSAGVVCAAPLGVGFRGGPWPEVRGHGEGCEVCMERLAVELPPAGGGACVLK